MDKGTWAIVHQDVSLEPAFYITGHRSGHLLWAIVAYREHAEKLCRDYQAQGYVHLCIHALHVADGAYYQDWMREHAPTESRNG